MDKKAIIRRAWTLFEPELEEQGYELVEVEYTKMSGTPVLRVFMDKAGGGITHDDCAAVSQVLSVVLDAEDILQSEYMLEISSPGIDRPLRKAADFERFRGERIRLSAQTPLDGRKQFTGELKGFQDGLITVECDGRPYEIHIENLKKANLDR